MLRPTNDRLLVIAEEETKTTKGGIIIPDTIKEKPYRGKVISTGPGKLLENGTRAAMQVNPGDIIIFGKYAGTKIKMEEIEYMLIKDEEVLAVDEPDAVIEVPLMPGVPLDEDLSLVDELE